MDLTSLLTGMSSQMSAVTTALHMSTAVASKALDSQESTGQAVLDLIESATADPMYKAKASGKGLRLDVVA